MTSYAELNDEQYTTLRRNLIREKGSDTQIELLSTIRMGNLPNYIRERVNTTPGNELPLLGMKLTESEFKNPPTDTQQKVYKTWKGIPKYLAYRPSFWAYLTMRHIENDLIPSTGLTTNGSTNGATRIDQSLSKPLTDEKRNKGIDDRIRDILRRSGGLPEARGPRSILVDCPLARCWWQENILAEITSLSSRQRNTLREAFCIKSQYWAIFVSRVLDRNSTFGSLEIRQTLLEETADILASDVDHSIGTWEGLQKACQQVSIQQGYQELSVLDDQKRKKIMAKAIR